MDTPPPIRPSWAQSICTGQPVPGQHPPALTFTVSRFLPWKVTSVSWFMGMTSGLGSRNWGQVSSCREQVWSVPPGWSPQPSTPCSPHDPSPCELGQCPLQGWVRPLDTHGSAGPTGRSSGCWRRRCTWGRGGGDTVSAVGGWGEHGPGGQAGATLTAGSPPGSWPPGSHRRGTGGR